MFKHVFLSLILLITSFPSSSALIEFQPQTSVKAQEINSNFNHIKNILHNKNVEVNFAPFAKDSVIKSSDFETEFNKVRALGIEVSPLGLLFIKSVELNTAFQQMEQGTVAYDDTPQISDLTFFTDEDQSYSGSFSIVNTVGSSSVEITSPPQHGSLNKTGLNFSYDPAFNYFGADSFSYRAFDGLNYSETKTAIITVNSVNDVPVSLPQSVSTNEDVAKSIAVSVSDVENSPLTYFIVSAPTKGVLTGSAPNYLYTPNENENGSDSFSFKANDGAVDSNTSVVSIAINPVNDEPVALVQSATTAEDVSKPLTLSGSDIENSALIYSITTQPSHGILSGSGASLTYVPAANYNGTDSFVFKVNDGALDSALATVNLTITAVNDIPVANNNSFNITEDSSAAVTLTASDIENSALTYTIITSPAHGSLSGTIPNLTYTPSLNYNGTDSFNFKVNDGSADSAFATVNFTIAANNDAPVLQPIGAIALNHTQSYSGTAVATDVDSPTITYSISQQAAKGIAAINSTSGALTYTLNSSSYLGADSFIVRASDGSLFSEVTASVTTSCASSFHAESGSCFADTRSCAINHGSGSQTWNGSAYSTCAPTSCDQYFQIEGNSCISIWPSGADGDVTLAAGTTTIPAGSIKNYNNLTIPAGSTLKIVADSSGSVTQLGIKGNLVLNGSIVVQDGIFGSVSVPVTTPNRENVTYSVTQSLAGAGGAGTSSSAGAGGGAGTLGIGGGGGGGGGYPSGGAGGINGGDGNGGSGDGGGTGNATLGNGVSWSSGYPVRGMNGGGSGGGGGSYNPANGLGGGGGGGGGYKGKHGLGLYVYVKGTISGTGSINASGTNGFNGGTGAVANLGQGGCGGGGAGGSGGKVWVRSPAVSFPGSISVNVGFGNGGSGGVRSGQNAGGNGAAGVAGSFNYSTPP